MSKRVEGRPTVAYVPGSPDARVEWSHAEVVAIAFYARRRLRDPEDEISERHFTNTVHQVEKYTNEYRRWQRNGSGPSRVAERFPNGIKEAYDLVQNALVVSDIKSRGNSRFLTQAVQDWAEMQCWNLHVLLPEFRFPQVVECEAPITAAGTTQVPDQLQSADTAATLSGTVPELPQGFKRLQAAGLAAWAHFGPEVINSGRKPAFKDVKAWLKEWYREQGKELDVDREIETVDSALFSPRRPSR